MINIQNISNSTSPPGFFSWFLLALDWIHNSLYTDEKIYIDWSHNNNSKKNLWSLFFEQPFFKKDTFLLNTSNFRNNCNKKILYEHLDKIIPIYNKYNGYFANNPQIYRDNKFYTVRNEFNKAWCHLIFKENILSEINALKIKINKTKNLGVAVRIPSHYAVSPEGLAVVNLINPREFYEKILKEIEIEFYTNDYEKIFICCDVQPFIDLLIAKFGKKKLIYIDYERVKTYDDDWVTKNIPLEKEYKLVLFDTLLLSECNFLMGGSSNIFLSSLFINKNVNFKLFDCLKDLYGL